MGKSAGWVKEEATGVWSGKKNAARVKEEAIGVWSSKGKSLLGSKGKPSECGLERKITARVKGKAEGVWSGKQNRRLGQRNFAPKSRTIKK